MFGRLSARIPAAVTAETRTIALQRPTMAGLALSRHSGAIVGGSRRQYSSSSSGAGEPNAHRNFYKQFSRPIAKVFLPAVFTYQAVYWLWVKLEKDEVKAEKEAEIAALENKLREVTAEKKSSATS